MRNISMAFIIVSSLVFYEESTRERTGGITWQHMLPPDGLSARPPKLVLLVLLVLGRIRMYETPSASLTLLQRGNEGVYRNGRKCLKTRCTTHPQLHRNPCHRLRVWSFQ